MKRRTSVQGTSIQGLDPRTKAWTEGATRNKAARTNKQVKDAGRIRIKIECTTLLKKALAIAAQDLGTSTSQLAAYLLAQALTIHLCNKDEIPVTPSRSPRIACNIDQTRVLQALTTAAESQQCLIQLLQRDPRRGH